MSNPLSIFSFKPAEIKLGNGNVAFIRRMPAEGKVEWQDYMTSKSEDEKTSANAAVNLEDSARLLLKALCDKDGNPLFTDTATIKKIDTVTLDYLLEQTMIVNGMGKAGQEAVEKKSESPPADTDS